ncbi:MAG: PilZ domain-containing protein [Deltaproteobacteria bacterium]|nr:PilZ domain-containing protein [Deltaproteobacteria bacterium]
MSEPVYIYQEKQQQGPFDLTKVQEMFRKNMISQTAYIFKVGWKDWRPIGECQLELGLTEHELPPPPPGELVEHRERAPRASIEGKIMIHTGRQLALGSGVNVSPTGIFVETEEHFFNVGEKIKLTCKVHELGHPFRAEATVIRISEKPKGYGFRFEGIDKKISKEIQKIIDRMNKELRKAS